MYAYAFLGESVLLYPLYALLFADTGLSTAQISSLFAIWSITGFVLEVPSGVLADATSRRRLLTIAPLLAGAAFAIWVAAPSYATFALGFVLWGTCGALQSGASEALIYEELDRLGAAQRYAQVTGRATAIGVGASALAMGLAAPAFAAGGFQAAGAASVLTCIAAAAVAVTLPEHRAAADAGARADLRAHAAVLRAGLAEVRSRPAVRGAVLLVPAVVAVWGVLDEYVPLLAAGTGAGTEGAVLLGLLVYAGVAAGGLLGGPAGRLTRAGLGVVLALAGAGLAVGALSGTALGFVAVAAAFAAFQAATIAVDARLQAAITGPARSTVTSIASLATEIVVLLAFSAYGAGSAVAGHGSLFAAFAAVYVVVAAVLMRGVHARHAASSRDATADAASP